MRNLVIIIVAVVVLGGGYFLLTQGKNNSSSNSSSSSSLDKSNSSSQTADNCPNAPEANDTTTITYTSSGFSPSVVSLKSGGKLTVKNSSSNDLQFNSNPHPVHTDDSDLNVGEIANGGQMTVTLTKTGCFGYHNHLQSGDGGNILIK